jgi:hypothetical protein
MSEIFKKPSRLRLRGGFAKPGEPFPFFSSPKYNEANHAETRCHDGRGPPESESVFGSGLNSFPDSLGRAALGRALTPSKKRYRAAERPYFPEKGGKNYGT